MAQSAHAKVQLIGPSGRTNQGPYIEQLCTKLVVASRKSVQRERKVSAPDPMASLKLVREIESYTQNSIDMDLRTQGRIEFADLAYTSAGILRHEIIKL